MVNWKENSLLLTVVVVIGAMILAMIEARTWFEIAAYVAFIALTLLVGSIFHKRIDSHTRTTSVRRNS